MHLLPASTEYPSERRIVGAVTLLLHILLAWCWLHAAGQGSGVAGAGDARQDDGEALVVEFVAIPAEESTHAGIPAVPALDPSSPRGTGIHSGRGGANADLGHRRILGERGESVAPEAASASSIASPSKTTAAAPGMAKRGSPASDLVAHYHAALRARIARTWRTLTSRVFPSGCNLHLTQSPGGAVTATSANGCALSQEDRLQLEAAALMAQPLPYAGYESVFGEDIVLRL